MRIIEAINPFILKLGIKSNIAIAISVDGTNHAIVPAYGFNNGEAVNIFLKSPLSVNLLMEVYRKSNRSKALIISAIRTDFFTL